MQELTNKVAASDQKRMEEQEENGIEEHNESLPYLDRDSVPEVQASHDSCPEPPNKEVDGFEDLDCYIISEVVQNPLTVLISCPEAKMLKEENFDETGNEMILGSTHGHEREKPNEPEKRSPEVLAPEVGPNEMAEEEEHAQKVLGFQDHEEHIGLDDDDIVEDEDLEMAGLRHQLEVEKMNMVGADENQSQKFQGCKEQVESIGLDEEEEERLRDMGDVKTAFGKNFEAASAILGLEQEPELILPCIKGRSKKLIIKKKIII